MYILGCFASKRPQQKLLRYLFGVLSQQNVIWNGQWTFPDWLTETLKSLQSRVSVLLAKRVPFQFPTLELVSLGGKNLSHALKTGFWYLCPLNNLSIVSVLFLSAAQPIYLCPVDLHKLQHLCGFNVVERYKKVNNLIVLFYTYVR